MMRESENNIRLPDAWRGWTIMEQIGTGSFGTVYLAEKGKKKSAIKVISLPRDDSEKAALLVECKSEDAAHQYLENLLENYSKEIRPCMYCRRILIS